MKYLFIASIFAFALCFTISKKTFSQQSGRTIKELRSGWLFIHKDISNGAQNVLDEKDWQKVEIPHDWAISGPFSEENDLQTTKVTEDGDRKAMLRSGRTAGLPYEGVGWYRKHLVFNEQDKGNAFSLEFDGAMSHAKVFLNDKFVGEWPYGYSSFSFDITRFINFGKDNVLAVRLENQVESARWYPGAGLYRNVRLVETSPVHIAHWGTFVTTPKISAALALVKIQTNIETGNGETGKISLETILFNQSNEKVGKNTSIQDIQKNNKFIQEVNISNPQLWSAEHPKLYYAVSKVKKGEQVIDQYRTIFGIRKINFHPQTGMTVNGIPTKLKGVCLHDDLGPLGMAINKSALRYRLKLLKQMGCNAVRGTHNPHAPEMLELCDELGFYYIDEAFDEWKAGKVKNGYHTLFDGWAKKDLEAMIERDRNHPALIMYSIGNEIREQGEKDGAKLTKYLTDICHANDATRPVTAAFNNMDSAIMNGLANAVDIPGWNYKPGFYTLLHQKHPKWIIYGSETASTVSSRGAYKLPAKIGIMKLWPDNQSSAYDLEYCSWSQLPDIEWKKQENDFVAGEFVWTGYDYLGEPTPYNANWPSRSSYFGIIDLSGIPKDRYYLYQSHWSNQKVLHILPHWNWKGHEGEVVPVFVYTNYPSAEVFINGKSYGKKTFDKNSLLDSYRLRWENTIYQPGELKVVAYEKNGKVAETKVIKTAGSPSTIELKSNTTQLSANGEDLAFITVSIKDIYGNLCPLADNVVHFKVTGEGKLRAVGNGNSASLEPFEADYRKAFYGKCMAIIQSGHQTGKVTIEASGVGLKASNLTLEISTK
ncbi:beta-galactosidase GalB [Ginsengibacter hankyongi]|uniref:beta-galactosidase GalB n=1 Tax=Ginsengibacter hankyongi TaxID=2607284 RepID=UPI001928510A|nr:beta-galactosidase GalB [Ginsengibacter hankyongi]